MRKRKRNSFAKMGTVCLVLMVSLGVMGTAYGYWSDTLDISSTMQTGSFGAQVSCDGCYTNIPDGSISCDDTNNVLALTVTDAHIGVIYSCNFHITNNGSIPLKIQEIVKTNVPEGVVVDVALVVPGSPIDPGGALGGVVQVSLTPEPPDNLSEGTTFTLIVSFEVVQWNQYVP